MSTLKITTWNIKHLSRVLSSNDASLQTRKKAIADEILQIDPDILCIIEGPGDITLLQVFVDDPNGLNGQYRIPVIPGTTDILNTNPKKQEKAGSGLAINYTFYKTHKMVRK